MAPRFPSPGDVILLRFPKPHAPQTQDLHAYPAIVVRVYQAPEGERRHELGDAGTQFLSAVVFVDFVSNVPRPRSGIHVAGGAVPGPALTCMDIRPYNEAEPDVGGWTWREEPSDG